MLDGEPPVLPFSPGVSESIRHPGPAFREPHLPLGWGSWGHCGHRPQLGWGAPCSRILGVPPGQRARDPGGAGGYQGPSRARLWHWGGWSGSGRRSPHCPVSVVEVRAVQAVQRGLGPGEPAGPWCRCRASPRALLTRRTHIPLGTGWGAPCPASLPGPRGGAGRFWNQWEPDQWIRHRKSPAEVPGGCRSEAPIPNLFLG